MIWPTRSECSAELELQFAKARFAQDYDCVAVKLLADVVADPSQPEVSAVTPSPVGSADTAVCVTQPAAGTQVTRLSCAMRAIRCWSAR